MDAGLSLELMELQRLAATVSRQSLGYPYANSPIKANAVYSREIGETREVSVTCFELGLGARIPQHNHPGMTVLSAVIMGAVQETAWHVGNSDRNSNADGRHAECTRCEVHRAGDAFFTLPHVEDGNIHEFVGLDPDGTVILDWISPPYDHDEQSTNPRVCTYYAWSPSNRSNGPPAVGAIGRLQPLPIAPVSFNIVSRAYGGVEQLQLGG